MKLTRRSLMKWIGGGAAAAVVAPAVATVDDSWYVESVTDHELSERVIRPAMTKLAGQIDSDIMRLYSNGVSGVFRERSIMAKLKS